MKQNLLLLLSLLYGMFVSITLSANTITVNTSADEDDACPGGVSISLREAVKCAAPGDTILFDSSLDGVAIKLDFQIFVDKRLTILGNDTLNTILDGQNKTRIFRVTSSDTAFIRGIRFIQGLATPVPDIFNLELGGAVLNLGILVLTDCLFEDNAADYGGAVDNESILIGKRLHMRNNSARTSGGGLYDFGILELEYAHVSDNLAPYGGGIYVQNDSDRLKHCVIEKNEASLWGGGILSRSELRIDSSTIEDNFAVLGGGLYIEEVSAILTHCVIEKNGSYDWGGGVLNQGYLRIDSSRIDSNYTYYDGAGISNEYKLVLSEVQFKGNRGADDGGAISHYLDTVWCTNVTIDGNEAYERGGGIYIDDQAVMILEHADILKNTSRSFFSVGGGGGVWNEGTFIGEHLNISENFIPNGYGGGLFNGGTCRLENTMVSDNKTEADFGGGIDNDGQMTLSEVDIMRNEAFGWTTNSGGGGLSCYGTITGESIRLKENVSGWLGGGLLIGGQGNAEFSNLTVSGNQSYIAGGGISVSGGVLKIENGLISGNLVEMGYGGGVYTREDGSTFLQNTSITGNRAETGGGISLEGDNASLSIGNSIVAKNISTEIFPGGTQDLTPDFDWYSGTAETFGNNLIGDTTGTFDLFGPNDLLGGRDMPLDPLFVEDVDTMNLPNCTGDLHLIPCSPAINFGDTTGFGDMVSEIDLDNLPRIVEEKIDLGTYEYQSLQPRPVALCQPATVQLDSDGEGSLFTSQVDNGSSYACGTVTLSVRPNTFDCSHVGSPQTVILTVTDQSSNTSTCIQTVTVLDEVAPTPLCQAASVVLDSDGQGTLLATQVDAGSSDACGSVTLSVRPNTFDCSHVGSPQTVILTVTDQSSNISTCSQTVTVERTVAISCNWTGAEDTDWFNPANWSSSCMPEPIDDVFIPASAPHQPQLSGGSSEIAHLVVESGASFLIDGMLIAIVTSGDAVINDGMITVKGTFNFGGGNFINNGMLNGTGTIQETPVD
jgi:hypothetical protein